MERVLLFHTGFQKIEAPDIRRGRANADFGQGFYLSGDGEFSRRWARARRGETTWLNVYELRTAGLRIKRFQRDAEWFDYIYHNRAGLADALAEFDVIVGPIANDTIYDTFGISTSGLLTPAQAIRLLLIGPVYEQTAIKTERAARQLRFVDARVLSEAEIAGYRKTVQQEQEAYQKAFAAEMARLLET